MSRATRERLERYFCKLPQSELIPLFLKMLQESSLWRQRELVDIVAGVILPGKAWLSLLSEQDNRRCRQLAPICLRLWSNQQVSEALVQGVEAALQKQECNQLQWLMTLTLKVAKERPGIALRPVERLLWKRQKADKSRWWTIPSLGDQVEVFHRELAPFLAPADTPLIAAAPPENQKLPLPAEAAPTIEKNLPVPSDRAEALHPGIWRRIWDRFLR